MALALTFALAQSACGGGNESPIAAALASTSAETPGQGSVVQQQSITTSSLTVNSDAGPFWSQSSSSPIASFDAAPDRAGAWTFYNGAEFPGATGALTETTGISGKAASLIYDLSCGLNQWTLANGRICGRYVSMSLSLTSPITVGLGDIPTISADLRNVQASANASLRVVDSTGQTLQFSVPPRTLESSDGSKWQRVVVLVGSSTLFYGGANDGVLHSPIRSIAFMAGDTPSLAPIGSLDIDNVAYLRLPDTSFNLKVDAPLSTNSFASSYFGRIGVAWHPKDTYAPVDKAIAAGIRLFRVDLNWQRVESNGRFDFSYYTNLAAELGKRNAKVLWILCYGHPDHGGATPLTAPDQAAFAEFARQAALAFKGKNVVGFEIWNEPNWPGFWPSPDATAYGNLLAQATAAIHASDTDAVVSTGGLADTDRDFLIKLIRTGKATGVNAIALHPYRKTAPETYANQITGLERTAAANGLAVPIWDSEWGYSSFADLDRSVYGDGHDPRALRRQAVLTLRKVLTHLALNTPISVLYDLVDDGINPLDREQNFGLMHYDGSDKPSIQGLRVLAAAQSGRTFKGFLPDVPPGLHVLTFEGTADKIFVIWADNAGVNSTITLPVKTTQVVNWDGTTPPTLTTNLDKSRTYVAQESAGPTFITVSK